MQKPARGLALLLTPLLIKSLAEDPIAAAVLVLDAVVIARPLRRAAVERGG